MCGHLCLGHGQRLPLVPAAGGNLSCLLSIALQVGEALLFLCFRRRGMFLGLRGSRTLADALGDCACCELGRGRGAKTAAWENCLEPCSGPGWLQPTREEAESRELVNFRNLCHRPKKGDVRMHCCLSNHSLITPWVLGGRRTLLEVLPSYSSGLCLHPPWAYCLREETSCCVNYPWFVLGSVV